MLKVLFYINIFAILMSCHSCRREKANVGITNVVEEWINKEIKFDNEYVFTRLGKDSVYNSIPTSKYKILVYTDSIGCVGCNLTRTIAQAEALKKMLAERGQSVNVMLDLDVPEDELMKRLIKRGQESGRADDNEETIKKRLTVYHSQTAPLIDWYKNEKLYAHIKGIGELDTITADVCKAIDAAK